MKIEVTAKHEVAFTVEYFSANEGGMDNEQYGGAVGTIEEAINLLMLARTARKKQDWVIVGKLKP